MTPEQARHEVVAYWLQQAKAALASADDEYQAGRFGFAVNRAYYACFYAAEAALLQDGRQFKRHSGVRSALHQYLLNTGRMDASFGSLYDRLFDLRTQADYEVFTQVNRQEVATLIEQAKTFVATAETLITPKDP